MEKELTFTVEEIRHIDKSEYDSDDYMLARIKFLSTRPNTHEITISEDVLRASANTVLGKWVTGEVLCGDFTTHTDNQVICGIVPKEQDVEFVEADDGYLDAYVDCIISKRYAKQYCNVFSEDDDVRAVSIEASFNMKDKNEAESFNIKTITTLGRNVRPSVPGADITITRFSEQDAEEYYRMSQADSLSKLKTFVEERKTSMAGKKYVSHPINTSKDAVYTGDWDGNKAKQDLIEEKNYKSLAPKVCLKLEEGWEDREVTKLGYPVMGLYDGEWRYSTKAIASAQSYAEQNDETEVLNKIKEIRKKLELDTDSERKEDAEMEEVKEIEVIEAESKTEEMADVECEEVKAAECEEDRDECDPEHDDEPDMEDMKAKLAKLEADIAERDNIIMDKDAELEELRKFKAEVEEQRKAAMVESIMAECKEYMSAEQFAKTREDGMACKPEELDAWSNRAKAVCFSAVKKSAKKAPVDNGVWGFAAPINPNKSNGLWD